MFSKRKRKRIFRILIALCLAGALACVIMMANELAVYGVTMVAGMLGFIFAILLFAAGLFISASRGNKGKDKKNELPQNTAYRSRRPKKARA